jgi:F0F1-type ATP synthase delta subunit
MILARLYAELLVKILGNGAKDADQKIEHFITLLKSRGHEKLLPRIVREFERALAKARRGTDVVLSVARAEDRGKFLGAAKEVLAQAGRKGEIREEVDEQLVRGFTLEANDFRYDASARRKLLALYEALTA